MQETVRLAIEKSNGLMPDNVMVMNDSTSPVDGLPEGVHHRERCQLDLDRTPNTFVRITENYLRALRAVSKPSPYEDRQVCCVCEDDVIFAKCWYSHAKELASTVARDTPFYAISLLHYYERADFSSGTIVGGRELLRWGDPNSFYGQQGMVFSAMTARHLAMEWEIALEQAKTSGDVPGNLLVDMGLKTMIIRLRVPLYTVHPNLIQHIGDVSGVIPRDTPLRTRHYWSGE